MALDVPLPTQRKPNLKTRNWNSNHPHHVSTDLSLVIYPSLETLLNSLHHPTHGKKRDATKLKKPHEQ